MVKWARLVSLQPSQPSKEKPVQHRFCQFFFIIGLRRCTAHEWLSLLMDSVCHSPLRFQSLGHVQLRQVDFSCTSVSFLRPFWPRSQLLLPPILPASADVHWVCSQIQIKWGKRDLRIPASFTRNNLQTDFTPQHSARLEVQKLRSGDFWHMNQCFAAISRPVSLEKNDLRGTNSLRLNQLQTCLTGVLIKHLSNPSTLKLGIHFVPFCAFLKCSQSDK